MVSMEDHKLKVYEQLCNSYRAIDDFRAKLLGLLPLATGAGMFFGADKWSNNPGPFLPAISAFGFVITLALFFYELYGIKKCTYIIWAGQDLEKELNIMNGQFTTRPAGVAGFINEPFAAGVIYPAVMGAWAYITAATAYQAYHAKRLAIFIFLAGFISLLLYSLHLKNMGKNRSR